MSNDRESIRWTTKIIVGGFAEEWAYVCSGCGCQISDRSGLGLSDWCKPNQRLNFCPSCGKPTENSGKPT